MHRLLLVLALAACTDEDPSFDLGPSVDLRAPLSACGRPGETGNAFGVGKFCFEAEDCKDNSHSTVCSAARNNPDTPNKGDSYFCTFACTADAGINACGIGAHCACFAPGCTCVPRRCSDGGLSF